MVKFLLMKKELNRNPETQLVEDVICLVFVEYYLQDFAAEKHDDEKVVDILKKTLVKMSSRAIDEVVTHSLSPEGASQLISYGGKSSRFEDHHCHSLRFTNL